MEEATDDLGVVLGGVEDGNRGEETDEAPVEGGQGGQVMQWWEGLLSRLVGCIRMLSMRPEKIK